MDESISNHLSLFKEMVEAEHVDLGKLGFTECRNVDKCLSYVRGYVWRNYKIRIKPPLDDIILAMLLDVGIETHKLHRKWKEPSP